MKVVILTGPSGAGKYTLARLLAKKFPQLEFSISVTTRPPREGEKEGVDYYFWTVEEFMSKVKEGAFLEYEEVYPGIYYGTLKSEIERIFRIGKVALMDIDVKGALKVKKILGRSALTIFIHPGSLQNLKERLKKRGTENEHAIKIRLDRAVKELAMKDLFDICVWNIDLNATLQTLEKITKWFLEAEKTAKTTG